MNPASKHIAVYRLSAMGDVAMIVPVLRAFVGQYPQVKITVVSKPFFQPFFSGIDNVSYFGVDTQERHKGIIGIFRLFSDLNRLNIDAFADLHQVLRSKILRTLFALSGKKTASLDKSRLDKKALTRAGAKIFRQLPTVFERQLDVFKALGFEISLDHPTFPPKSTLPIKVAALTGEKNTNWIGIAPFAQHQSKVYPADLMREVIQSLAANSENNLFLFGAGQEEIADLKDFAGSHNGIIVVAGNLELSEELKLIQHLDVMLSMDSANGHLAAIFGVPVISLWGATHPFAGFAPFNQPFANSIVPDREQFPKLPTSIYGNKYVEGYEDVMRTITPSEVIRKIESVLSE